MSTLPPRREIRDAASNDLGGPGRLTAGGHYFISEHSHCSGVAQLVEQAAVNRLVGGSSPSA